MDRVERARQSHDVTRNGVTFEWELASIRGASFKLLREAHHTDQDIETAKLFIRGGRDVVGDIRVETV